MVLSDLGSYIWLRPQPLSAACTNPGFCRFGGGTHNQVGSTRVDMPGIIAVNLFYGHDVDSGDLPERLMRLSQYGNCHPSYKWSDLAAVVARDE